MTHINDGDDGQLYANLLSLMEKGIIEYNPIKKTYHLTEYGTRVAVAAARNQIKGELGD